MVQVTTQEVFVYKDLRGFQNLAGLVMVQVTTQEVFVYKDLRGFQNPAGLPLKNL